MVKIPAVWKPQPSGTSTSANQGFVRITQALARRITQDGNVRVLNESVVVTKIPAVWTAN